MQISLHKLGKRFNYEWIFRNLDYEFGSGHSYALLGHNGSGKSTLLNVLSGHHLASEGEVVYKYQNKIIEPEHIFRHLSLAAPYQELVEELTLQEMLHFHTRFKSLRQGLQPEQLLDRLLLHKARHKYIKDFSSGMRQRLKLGLAIYTDSPLLLLDEPTTNLDADGVAWYREHLFNSMQDRLVIIGSNITHEYDFCDHFLRISDYHLKPKNT